MKGTVKSLGEFVASVLSTISGATYIPAAVIVGGAWLAGILATTKERTPADAVVHAPMPGFAQLGVFLVVVLLVAAVLEPIQFWLTRIAEGHIQIPLVGPARQRHWVALHDELAQRREQASDEIESAVSGSGPDLTKDAVDALHETIRSASATLRAFPQRDRIVATRLGNLVRSFEDSANTELKAAGSSLPGNGEIQDLMPFAAFAIPELTRQEHSYFRSQLQCMVTLMLVAPVVTATIAITLGLTFGISGWTAGVIVVGVVVTVACASGARSAGDGYGRMLLAIARQYTVGVVTVMAQTDDGGNRVLTSAAS